MRARLVIVSSSSSSPSVLPPERVLVVSDPRRGRGDVGDGFESIRVDDDEVEHSEVSDSFAELFHSSFLTIGLAFECVHTADTGIRSPPLPLSSPLSLDFGRSLLGKGKKTLSAGIVCTSENAACR